MALTLEDYGKLFVQTGDSLEGNASDALFGVMQEARDEIVSNLEREKTSGGAGMRKLTPLTLLIREEQGIKGKKRGQATGKMLKSLKDKNAVVRIGKFTFEIRPKSEKELEKMERFINPATKKSTTKKQAGKIYALTGKKVWIPPGSRIRKPARNFKLSDKKTTEFQERGAGFVSDVILTGIGATTGGAVFQGRSPGSRRK